MKLFHALARKIVTGWNTKLIAIICIISDTCVDSSGISSTTFHTIDGSNCGSKSLSYDRVHMIHPEPKCCFKGHYWIISHRFRIVQAIKPYALSSRPVIVVPWYLKRSTTIVTLSSYTWVLCVALIAIVLRGTIYFFYVTKVYTQKISSLDKAYVITLCDKN